MHDTLQCGIRVQPTVNEEFGFSESKHKMKADFLPFFSWEKQNRKYHSNGTRFTSILKSL